MIQSEIVRTGTKACRFEIRPGDHVSQGLRAELRDWYNAPFEEDTWYGFSTYLPKDFEPPKGVGIVLAQWHDQAELGDPSGKPPLAIRYLDGACASPGRFRKSPRRTRTSAMFSTKCRMSPTKRGSTSSSAIHWSKARRFQHRRLSRRAADCSASPGRSATATR